MGQVVSDTTPVSTLAEMGFIHLLPVLFGQVVVPPEVVRELKHPDAPIQARLLIDNPPSWIAIQPPRRTAHFPGIHAGESAAIQLAIEHHARLIIDDRKGRDYAERLGIGIVGTVGVLEIAADRGIIPDLAFVHQALRRTSFRVSDDVLNASLARHMSRKMH